MPTPPYVAALFVEPDGVYGDLDGVDVWDRDRDARLYAGPYPVVAHPPCARWSRLAGFTEARFGYRRGQDYGCFEAALAAVRTYGGVLEHPAYSAAWPAYGLTEPLWRGGWTLAFDGGAVCYVEQGRYGLPVKKATWLYAYRVELPELRWGFTPDTDGERVSTEFGGIDGWRDTWTTKSSRATSATPPAFRDALLGMAFSVEQYAQIDGVQVAE
jgi:hypothetical protein